MAKTPWSFGRSECNRVKLTSIWSCFVFSNMISTSLMMNIPRIANSFFKSQSIQKGANRIVCLVGLKLNGYCTFQGVTTLSFPFFAPLMIVGPCQSCKKSLTRNFKDCLPYLFHSFRNKYFNKVSLGNILYFQNKLYKF